MTRFERRGGVFFFFCLAVRVGDLGGGVARAATRGLGTTAPTAVAPRAAVRILASSSCVYRLLGPGTTARMARPARCTAVRLVAPRASAARTAARISAISSGDQQVPNPDGK